ncbi:hypothetical protein PACILC2_50620 [Paenibacillus cisolokensis]|uniref:Uncharacterized protein n=1 Tax=Paenibacillus cisolokensis TaxID=1658519 RepID=A0ABQ4NE48_9BACL|nr:hypothetical protein PACILC2_50620 [Paenibacillus cisolokensis]
MLPSVLTEVREHFFITEGGGVVRSFWIWLFMLAASWLAALLHNGMEQVRAYELAGCAVFSPCSSWRRFSGFGRLL